MGGFVVWYLYAILHVSDFPPFTPVCASEFAPISLPMSFLLLVFFGLTWTKGLFAILNHDPAIEMGGIYLAVTGLQGRHLCPPTTLLVAPWLPEDVLTDRYFVTLTDMPLLDYVAFVHCSSSIRLSWPEHQYWWNEYNLRSQSKRFYEQHRWLCFCLVADENSRVFCSNWILPFTERKFTNLTHFGCEGQRNYLFVFLTFWVCPEVVEGLVNRPQGRSCLAGLPEIDEI